MFDGCPPFDAVPRLPEKTVPHSGTDDGGGMFSIRIRRKYSDNIRFMQFGSRLIRGNALKTSITQRISQERGASLTRLTWKTLFHSRNRHLHSATI
jgi:hypothetical protein